MKPIYYYSQISDDPRDLDDETIAKIKKFMEFGDLRCMRHSDLLATIPFHRDFLTVYKGDYFWSLRRHSSAILKAQFDYEDGHLLALEQMSKGQVVKTIFGKFLRHESYITFIRMVEETDYKYPERYDPNATDYKYPVRYREGVILGGWSMQKLAADDPREPGDEYELDAMTAISIVNDRAIKVDWAIGEELRIDMVRGGHFGRVMPLFPRRIKWKSIWPWQRIQMKISRKSVLSAADTRWTVLFKLPYWLTLRSGMSVDYDGMSRKLMKAAIPQIMEIDIRYQQLAKEQGVDLEPFTKALRDEMKMQTKI